MSSENDSGTIGPSGFAGGGKGLGNSYLFGLPTNNVDDNGTEIYIGSCDTRNWMIQLVSLTNPDVALTYAIAGNNPLVTSYNDAWTNRIGLNYDKACDL